MLRPTKSRGADMVVLPKRISCESWDSDGRGITGTTNEMRKGVGLPGSWKLIWGHRWVSYWRRH